MLVYLKYFNNFLIKLYNKFKNLPVFVMVSPLVVSRYRNRLILIVGFMVEGLITQLNKIKNKKC